MTTPQTSDNWGGGRPAHSQSQMINLRECLTIFFRDLRIITIMAVVPLVISLLLLMVAEKKYVANATLLVRIGKEFLYRPDVSENSNAPMPIAFDREQILKSEVEILRSRDLAESVLLTVGTERIFPKLSGGDPEARHQSALRALHGAIDAVIVKETNVIEVSFAHPDSQIAANVVNALVDAYLSKRRSIFSDPRYIFIKEQADSFKSRLTEYEEKIYEFQKQTGIISYASQRDYLLQRRDEVANRLRQVEADLAENTEKLKSLRANGGKVLTNSVLYTDTGPDEVTNSTDKRLVDLRQKEERLRARYRDDHPMIADLRLEIAALEAQRAEHLKTRVDPSRTGRSQARETIEVAIVTYQAQADSAAALKETLTHQLAELNTSLNNLAEKQVELERMQREKEVIATSYQEYFRKLDQARIEEQIEGEKSNNIRIVQAALPPLEAKSPRKAILISGIVLSLVSAVVTAFVREIMRDAFLSHDKLTRTLGLRVLISLPQDRSNLPPRPLRDRLTPPSGEELKDSFAALTRWSFEALTSLVSLFHRRSK